jgi:hypothetical protein
MKIGPYEREVAFRAAFYSKHLSGVRRLETERLLAFHLFPSQHASRLRTTNPIESPFAAVKLRTNAVKRFRIPHLALHLLFKLLERSEKGLAEVESPGKTKGGELPRQPIRHRLHTILIIGFENRR